MREVVTSVLDLSGLLLVVLAVSVALWPWSPAAAILAAGLLLLLVSLVIDRRQGVK